MSFLAYRFLAQFEFLDMKHSPNPEEELKEIFRKCLNRAKQGAIEELHFEPNYYNVTIHSTILDYDMNSPIKQINEAEIGGLLTLFEKIDQSNKAKDRGSICEGVFTVDVWAIETKGRRGVKRKLAGGTRKNILDITYKLYPGALHAHIPFPDGYCLFYSLEWIRQKKLLSRDAYYKWRENPRRQMDDVNRLMDACRIPKGRDSYSILDWGHRIQVKKLTFYHTHSLQEYYDSEYPGLFRIIVFGRHGDYKPLYKTNVTHYEHPIVLLYNEEQLHYEPVAYPGKLFIRDGQYCFPVKYCVTLYLPF